MSGVPSITVIPVAVCNTRLEYSVIKVFVTSSSKGCFCYRIWCIFLFLPTPAHNLDFRYYIKITSILLLLLFFSEVMIYYSYGLTRAG